MHSINGTGLTTNPNFREMIIREKNVNSGVAFAVIKSATVGDISAIVARVLKCENEILVQMSGVGLSNEMKIEDFTDAAITKITYTVTNIKHSYPVSVINTSPFTAFFRWNVYKDHEGHEVLKFDTDNNAWPVKLNQVMPKENDNITEPNVAPTSSTNPIESLSNALAGVSLSPITAPQLNLNSKYANKLFENISSIRKLFKMEESGRSYIKTIGVVMNIDKRGQSIVIPPNSWVMYLVKGNTYNLFDVFDSEPTFGTIACHIGRFFSLRVGKISKAGQVNDEITYNAPPPEKYQGLYDKVVIQHNKTELIAPLET